MLVRDNRIDTASSAFFRTSSHFSSRHHARQAFNNTFATIATIAEPEPQREEDPKPELQIPEHILAIVEKRQGERSSSENSTIMKYLLKKAMFRFLTEKLSLDVVKNFIRQGNLTTYKQGEVFLFEGRKIRTVDILLFGEVYIISHLERDPDDPEDQPEAIRQTVVEDSQGEGAQAGLGERLDQLIEKVGREAKKFKLRGPAVGRKAKGEAERSLHRKENVNISDDTNLECCERVQAECFLDFLPLFRYEAKHSRTLAAREIVSVFSVPLEVFYEGLLHDYNQRLNQKLKLFRRVSIFDAFENGKLRTLIERLTVREYKKGELVYREGEEPRCFYLLISGEVEISKTIGIFSENPNNFYKNRVQVSREQAGRQIKILPYANFHGVYNYTPEQKVITLAQVTPICIFGEQEIVDSRRRQVNARVLSLSARLYEIHLDAIEDLCSRMIGSNGEKKITLSAFLLMMEQSLTLKKILFRQNQLSDLVSYENRSKYSTLFQGKPRRARSYPVPPPLPFLPPASSQELERTTGLHVAAEAPPQFNNFNFTDFLREGVEEEPVAGQLNEEEARVARLTHVKLSEAQQSKKRQKSIRLRSFSRELSTRTKATLQSFATVDSLSNKITLEQPLFTVNYFEKQFRDEKKLYVQAKKKRLENIYKHSPERIPRHS